MSQRISKAKFGTRERQSFSRVKDILDVPYLIEVQKDSYELFVKEGIKDVFQDFSPIYDYSNHYELYFLEHTLEGKEKCKYTEEECRERDATFAAPLKIKVRLVKKDTGEVMDQEVFMGDFPLMTENGSFIINGAERVVVSQLVRSPGVYSAKNLDKTGCDIFSTTVIPNRGAWLEFEQDGNSILWVKVDRTRKLAASVLLRALGFGSDEEIVELFGDDKIMKATTEKDMKKSEKDGLLELYTRLRPGEIPTEDAARKQLKDLFFDPKRYDLAKVGRYKFNKKLSLANRIKNQISHDDITIGDEVVVRAGEIISEEVAHKIQNSGINFVYVVAENTKVKVIGNNTVNLTAVTKFTAEETGIADLVSLSALNEILKNNKSKAAQLNEIKKNRDALLPKHITVNDIIATISYNLGLQNGIGVIDNIDHLGNRRVRSVGELLQNQFRIGISRLERVIKERMAVQDMASVSPQTLINIRPVSSAIKEFFGSSQLSQFMDQSNPIAELTHKRKLSALGPGGLNRERATFDVRDVHHSHYGRMCPIETPEGQNIGLISSLSSYARINEYGFIESPYRWVDKSKGVVTATVRYMTADEEDEYNVAQANEPLDASGRFINDRVSCRYMDEILLIPKGEVDFMDVSPKQLVSVATSLIPFLENDDTNRALMGSNMQRQAVPLLRAEAPIVGTGMEAKIAYDSGVMILAEEDGEVTSVTADIIEVTNSRGMTREYKLKKFKRSNQGTCINQKPIVESGTKVKKGDILADGPSTDGGELALGRNILIGFMSWEGYNYEDAILISEELVKDDTFTSIHIEEHELETRDTKLGPEEITRDIPNVGDEALKDLDEDGIIRIGAEVQPGDILVGKVTPKGEAELTPEERLLRAIFSEKARDVRDTSLRVLNGEGGIVVDVKIFTREQKDELAPGVNKIVRVYIAQKRKISVGDKMAGRHGNKGVISRILPAEDMPFMEDGRPLQIVLNPMGVPSRMNIGQVLEVHLGLVSKMLGWHVATPVFDGANENDIKTLFQENQLINPDTGKVDGKITLYDGRTGLPFENRVTVGYMYMLKLVHLVDDKIHARSTGPYSLVTQQPLGGKAQFGGQRFGEMEVWALKAYGAANILQEILTVKSDDVVGRVKTYESIVKGQNISEPGVPESFKVLIKELQSLVLDVKVLTEDKEEVGIKDIIDNAEITDFGDDEPFSGEISLDFEDLENDEFNLLGEDSFDELEDDDDLTKSASLFEEEDDF